MINNKDLNFFSQPYPFYYNGKSLIFIGFLIFTLTFVFNYIFKPFNLIIGEHKFDYVWICAIHAIVAVIIFLVLVLLINIKSNIDEKWIIRKELIFIISALLLIGVGQFLIRDLIYNNPNNWSLNYLYEEIGHTFLEGLLFIFIIVPLNFNFLFYQNSKNAKAFNLKHSEKPVSDLVKIETQVKDETFDLDISKLLYVKADGNYLEIFFLENNNVEKLIKRITIKDFLSKLSSYPFIVKTHRSYIVNLNKIVDIMGNAQGYKLRLNMLSKEIPVSRNLILHFNEMMQKIEK